MCGTVLLTRLEQKKGHLAHVVEVFGFRCHVPTEVARYGPQYPPLCYIPPTPEWHTRWESCWTADISAFLSTAFRWHVVYLGDRGLRPAKGLARRTYSGGSYPTPFRSVSFQRSQAHGPLSPSPAPAEQNTPLRSLFQLFWGSSYKLLSFD